MREIEPQNLDNEDIEIQLLLEAIYLKYGYDFRHYIRSSVKRQVLQRFSSSGLNNLLEMQQKVLYDPEFFNILLQDLSISFSEMFRDPSFYRAVKAHVIPVLQTYPSIKIWHAGCSTGEEVYSMAIVLKEEDLREPGFHGVLDGIYGYFAKKLEKNRWGEKTPMYLQHPLNFSRRP